MIHRPAPSSRSRSVTSPARVSLLTCGFTLATLTVATLNTPVAAADPSCTAQQRADYPGLCGVIESTTTPAPSSGGSSGGGIGDAISGFFDDWGGLIVLGFLAVMGTWIAVALMRDSAEEKEKKAQAERARGQQLAQQWHAEQVQRAHAEAAAQMPPREQWDPMGMGVQAPAIQVELPPAPSTDPIDLQRYTAFGAVTPWDAGTAFATVVDRDGNLARATAAWLTAAQEAGLGEVDEAGTFTPSAVLTNVRYDDGDVELVVQPAGLHVAEKQLDKALPYLVVAARVESASPFVREAATGRYVTTLTNAVREKSVPAPEAAPVNDPSSWEW